MSGPVLPLFWSNLFKPVVLFNGLLFATGLLIMELGFGQWFADRESLYLATIRRNVVVKHDVTELYPAGGTVAYERDGWGLRGDYGALADIDILSMGGSTTDQYYVAHEHTWNGVLARAFDEAIMEVDVANAGRDGHSTLGHLHCFDVWLPWLQTNGLHPRYVLFYVGINDMYVARAAGYDAGVAKDVARRDAALEGWTWKTHLRWRSAFYRAYVNVSYAYRSYRRGLTPLGHGQQTYPTLGWIDLPTDEPTNQEMTAALADYDRRLRRLAERVQRFGAHSIFVTQPSLMLRWRDGRYQYRSSDAANVLTEVRRLARFNRQTLETCRSLEQAVCIDLARELPFTDEDFYDRWHNTPAGGEKIGRYLFAQLNGLY